MKMKLRLLVLILAAVALPALGQTKHETNAPASLRNLYVDVPESVADPAQVVVVSRQVVNDYQCIPAPGNPPTGLVRFYCDSGTGNLTCITSSGGSCLASAATTAFSSLTASTNSNPGTFAMSGNTLNLTAATLTVTGHQLTVPLACLAASASGTAYTCTTSPTFVPADGDAIFFEADVASTGPATLVVNGQAGTPSIFKQGGNTALVANDLLIGGHTLLTFDGTNWQMLGQVGNAAAGFVNPMTTLGDSITGGAAGAATRLPGPTAPNGVPQVWTSTPSGGLATAEAWGIPALVTRDITSTTATDTIVSADCTPKVVNYQGSVAVAVTLPTATTLAVPSCTFSLTNNTSGSATAVTVTPTTWTVAPGGASIVIAQGQACRFTVDTVVATQWDAECHDGPIVAGANITITRGQFGPTIAASGGGAFPLTITGGVSGAVPCFTSTTVESAGAILNTNLLVKGGGAGACPTNSLFTDTGTTATYTGTGGLAAPTFTSTGTTASFMDWAQGTTSVAVAPCNTANSICEQAPTAVTSYLLNKLAGPSSGIKLESNSAAVLTESSSGDANHSLHVTGQTATKTIYTLCPASAGGCNVAGQYRVTWYFNQGGTACGTPTPGQVTFALSWTDNAGAHSAIALPMNDNSSIAVFTNAFKFASSNTTGFASGEFNLWSTGAQPIQVTNTYTACGVGTGTWELSASVEQVQ